MKMNLPSFEVQQAGLGLIGWAIIFLVLIPALRNISNSSKDEENPNQN